MRHRNGKKTIQAHRCSLVYESLEFRSLLTACPEVGSEFAYYVGQSCRLITPQDELGNRIPDFSTADYRNSNEPIPDVVQLLSSARFVNIEPIEGDNTAHIQAAIDTVEGYPPNAGR